MRKKSSTDLLEHADSAPRATSVLTIVDVFVGALLVAGWLASVASGCALPKSPHGGAGPAKPGAEGTPATQATELVGTL